MSQPVEIEGNLTVASTDPNEGDNSTGTNDPQHVDTTDLSPEQLHAELKKVRQEAASRRIELKEAKRKAEDWDKYQESQKTELQKLQDQLAEKDKAIAEKQTDLLRSTVAREYNVADEDLDLLVGDEDNMKRLAARLGNQTPQGGNAPADLLAGARGKPVGSAADNFSMDDWIRGKIK